VPTVVGGLPTGSSPPALNATHAVKSTQDSQSFTGLASIPIKAVNDCHDGK
jgi:hypothetical protein